MSVLTPELIAQYESLNGPSVSNAIESFDIRLRNEGFVDGRIRCLFPNHPPVIGYAVTARIRCSAPPPVGLSYHDRTDWWNYIVSVPPPRIVVVQDVDERPGVGAFVGDLHAIILQALGCVAYVTNGSVRDLEEVGRIGLQFFAPLVSISHAFAHIVDFGEPVDIGGLGVATGDVLFGDGDGLVQVPSSIVSQVPEAAARIRTKEERIVALCRSPQFSIDGLRALVRDLG